MKHDTFFQSPDALCRAKSQRLAFALSPLRGGQIKDTRSVFSAHWIRLTLCYLLFFWQNVNAQIIPETVQCGDLSVQALETADPNCSSQECNRAFFQIRLITDGSFIPSGGSSTSTFYLAYEEISVVIQMIGSDLYSLDETETKNCYASGNFPPSDYATYSTETDTRTVSFLLTNPSENGPVIAFTKLPNQNIWVANLFVVVMSTYPDATINPTFLSATYKYGSTTCFYPSSPSSPSYLQVNAAPYTAPSASATTEADVCLQFGTFDQNTKLLPVEAVNSAATNKSVRYLNFTFDVESTNLMVAPELTNFIQTPVYQKRIPIPGTNNYRFIVRFAPPNSPIALGPAGGSSAKQKLFDIKIEGPQLQTLLTTVQLCFVSGQIRTGNYNSPSDCKAACFSPTCADNINFGEANYCNPADFILRIRGHEETSDCNLLHSTVNLSWNVPSDPLSFERIKITLKFNLGNSVSIAYIGTNSFGCPSNPSCLPLGTYSNCFSINGDVVSFCFYPSIATNIYKDSGFEIYFNTPSGCVGGVTVTEALIDIAGSAPCIPSIEVQGFPLCPPLLEGKIRDEQGDIIDDVKVLITRNPALGSCQDVTLEPGNLPFSQCVCDYGSGISYTATPNVRFDGQNGNLNHYLNGVSTFDLVLISRHILGIELLNSPYKLIAADANGSNGVTTFDIVEIRKLILGIYSVFPNNTQSWRYIDEDHVFPNPTNPFLNDFTPYEKINVTSFPETQADFVAIKVGDVNNTHFDDLAPGKPAARVGEFAIEYPAVNAKPGEYITLPVTYRGTETLAAFQLGLAFDPQRLEFVGPAAGDLVGMNTDCFGFTEINSGKIRVVWLAMEPENYLVEGQTLFSLTFKVLRSEKNKTPLLQTDNAVLENLGFRTDGATYGLTANPLPLGERSRATVTNNTGIKVVCLPNPTAGTVTLHLETPAEKRVAVSVYSAFGVRKFYKELELPAGVTELNITEANNWPAGVYVWKVKSGKNKSQGTFIRQ